MPHRTTKQVAAQIGTTKVWIILAVSRHHHLKPARMFDSNYVWNDAEIVELETYLTTKMRQRKWRLG